MTLNQQLNNSKTVKNNVKWDGELRHLSVFVWAMLFLFSFAVDRWFRPKNQISTSYCSVARQKHSGLGWKSVWPQAKLFYTNFPEEKEGKTILTLTWCHKHCRVVSHLQHHATGAFCEWHTRHSFSLLRVNTNIKNSCKEVSIFKQLKSLFSFQQHEPLSCVV